MSTTMGLLVLWALTSVVRSQLYTFLTCRRSGWQSLGTTLEHCLWTFNPQSDRETQNFVLRHFMSIFKHLCFFIFYFTCNDPQESLLDCMMKVAFKCRRCRSPVQSPTHAVVITLTACTLAPKPVF